MARRLTNEREYPSERRVTRRDTPHHDEKESSYRRSRRSASPDKRRSPEKQEKEDSSSSSSSSSNNNSSNSNDAPRPVWFYGLTGPYGVLSNYFYSPMIVDGQSWSTAEAYFQSRKFPGARLRWMRDAIREARTPAEAKAIGVMNPSAREDNVRRAVIKARAEGVMPHREWHDIDQQVMLQALVQKFNQNPNLRELLLKTGDSPLKFDSSKDTHWGVGTNGRGKNLMGKLLDEVRTLMRERDIMETTTTS